MEIANKNPQSGFCFGKMVYFCYTVSMLTRYKIVWMVGILLTGMMGLVFADQTDFLGVFERNGGFAIKPSDLRVVGQELRVALPGEDQVGTVVPLRSSDSADPRARVIQSALRAEQQKNQ